MNITSKITLLLSVLATLTPIILSTKCPLPSTPNGVYTARCGEGSSQIENVKAEVNSNCEVTIKCSPGYSLDGRSSRSYCTEGEWITDVPVCKSEEAKNISEKKKIVCYYPNWSMGFKGTAKVVPEDIDPTLCTHIIYAFSELSENNTIGSVDSNLDITQNGFTRFTDLKKHNKNLNALIGIGGSEEGPKALSGLVTSPNRRAAFKKNAVTFLRTYNFDGLDMDWQFPKNKDKVNFVQFMKELKEEFDEESEKTSKPRLLLTMSIPSDITLVENGYDLQGLSKYTDFMSILTYDFHKPTEPNVNHHSPLFGLAEEKNKAKNIDYVVNFVINKGLDTKKLVLGVPIYGRTYTLTDENKTEIGSPAKGPGNKGPISNEAGYLTYYEICTSVFKDKTWKIVNRNKNRLGPYAYRKDQWIGYDDPETVKQKVKYANEKNLGGIMFWTIAYDDIRGACNGTRYPMLSAGKEALLGIEIEV